MKQLLFATLLALGIQVAAYADPLQDLKAQGALGEQRNGYLGVVASDSDQARQVAADINAKRRDYYQQIASKNGTTLAAVEALAGEKAIAKTEPGQYVQDSSGQWIKK